MYSNLLKNKFDRFKLRDINSIKFIRTKNKRFKTFIGKQKIRERDPF